MTQALGGPAASPSKPWVVVVVAQPMMIKRSAKIGASSGLNLNSGDTSRIKELTEPPSQSASTD